MSSWRRRWLVASQWTLSTYATDEPGAIPTKVLDLHSAAFVKRDEDCMLLVKTDHREYVFQLENKVSVPPMSPFGMSDVAATAW